VDERPEREALPKSPHHVYFFWWITRGFGVLALVLMTIEAHPKTTIQTKEKGEV